MYVFAGVSQVIHAYNSSAQTHAEAETIHFLWEEPSGLSVALFVNTFFIFRAELEKRTQTGWRVSLHAEWILPPLIILPIPPLVWPRRLQAGWPLTSGGRPVFSGEKGICHALLSHRLSLSAEPTCPNAAVWLFPSPPCQPLTCPTHKAPVHAGTLAAGGDLLLLSELNATSECYLVARGLFYFLLFILLRIVKETVIKSLSIKGLFSLACLMVSCPPMLALNFVEAIIKFRRVSLLLRPSSW